MKDYRHGSTGGPHQTLSHFPGVQRPAFRISSPFNAFCATVSRRQEKRKIFRNGQSFQMRLLLLLKTVQVIEKIFDVMCCTYFSPTPSKSLRPKLQKLDLIHL